MSQEQTVDAQIETALAVLPKDKSAIAIGERGLAFENAAELYRFSEALCKGGVAPKGATPGGVMAAILKGRALGVDEVTALTNISVIGGRVQIGGALVLALIRRHHACAELTYWWEGEGNTRAAFIRARRQDEREATTHRFGLDDAARAGLANEQRYRQWTDDMLLWRVVGRMGRRQFSDIVAGVYVPGEVPEAPAPVEATAAATPGAVEEPPPSDPLLAELEAPATSRAAVVERPAPIVEAQAVSASPSDPDQVPAEGEAAEPSREPGEDDDGATPPFPSHAEADRAIAEAEGQGRLFDPAAKAPAPAPTTEPTKARPRRTRAALTE